MPGYGTLPATEGSGLLRWSWAEERLARSHDYWLATVTPWGTPHIMPVWAIWHEGRLWFSSSNGSRKTRNLTGQPQCSMTTDDPLEPVVVEGAVERITDAGELERDAGRPRTTSTGRTTAWRCSTPPTTACSR
jgi:pyridoxine/pyridoxamine 5'-phosphate oxidase